jgi:hypothetical protein
MAREIAIDIVGQRVKQIRTMTPAEAEAQAWTLDRGRRAIVLVFENGITLFASRDYEGNGPGALFGTTRDGKSFAL